MYSLRRRCECIVQLRTFRLKFRKSTKEGGNKKMKIIVGLTEKKFQSYDQKCFLGEVYLKKWMIQQFISMIENCWFFLATPSVKRIGKTSGVSSSDAYGKWMGGRVKAGAMGGATDFDERRSLSNYSSVCHFLRKRSRFSISS